jgi:hypothetical protein
MTSAKRSRMQVSNSPKDNTAMLKIPPVMLGVPANKELWPKAIWPGTISGISLIGLRYNNYFQYTSGSRNQFNSLAPPGAIGPYIPATDFRQRGGWLDFRLFLPETCTSQRPDFKQAVRSILYVSSGPGRGTVASSKAVMAQVVTGWVRQHKTSTAS